LAPDELTLQLQTAVPILKFIEWKVLCIGYGFSKTILPINISSTNQIVTHQAALIMLAADYTGGIALGTVLEDVPIIGIHQTDLNHGAYLLAVKGNIKWIRPSCEDLTCVASIPDERHGIIKNRFSRKAPLVETVKIDMYNGNVLVATASISYWFQETNLLQKDAFDENKIHVLCEHRHKTSAKLVAGMRALEQEKSSSTRLFHDPYSEIMAGSHGKILAKRVFHAAPQFQSMIAIRTKHLDDALTSFHKGNAIQIVTVGVGLDSRVLRLKLPEHSVVFELDLPVMLHMRNELLRDISVSPTSRIPIGIDLRKHEIDTVLKKCEYYDTSMPTFFIIEGLALNCNIDVFFRCISSISRLINGASCIWFDYLKNNGSAENKNYKRVNTFMQEMNKLGEPLGAFDKDINGDITAYGLHVDSDVSSERFFELFDSLSDVYRFCTVKSDISHA
jgi:methyltransferase (TIGR00027 family)